MRFSAIQENGYGVGLPQDRFLGDADESTMAATENLETKNDNSLEGGSVVSNLPLLFANGYPTSLEKITLAQLERFITFMVQCSLGHDTTDVITKPQWWPKGVKFSNPLARPKKINDNWMANLKKLVFRCYTYHRSEYLLRFCSYLARYPHEELEYVNNWDSTTSLYHKSSGKLLVTFRNENMNYDKKSESPRKKLLSHNGATPGYLNKLKQQQHSLIMVEPPSEDIYLCDNCDAEFVGLEKMKEHEQTCCEQEHGSSSSRPATPDLIAVSKPELRQDQFLEYFHLCSTKAEVKSTETQSGDAVSNGVVRRTSRRVRGSINFTRCSTIPFSSPAGIVLAKKSKAMTEETQQERLERIERHLIAPVLSESCRPKWLDGEADRDRWIVTHKPNRDKPLLDHVHQYKFVNSVKRKPMLSIQSQLLYIVCRPVYVVLTRLNQEQIDELKRDPSKYRCPIRKISVNKKEPTTRVKAEALRTSVSSKRKAPGDESDSTGAEDEVITTDTSAGALAVYETIELPKVHGTTIIKPVPKTATVYSKPTNAIAVINLCSSDEEEDSNVPASSDENRDPMKSTDVDIRKSILRKLSPSKLCTKPCIYPADSTSDWLSENILNDDNENCTNKCRTTVALNACTHLSPILRPAP